jgi:hypothetical protein
MVLPFQQLKNLRLETNRIKHGLKKYVFRRYGYDTTMTKQAFRYCNDLQLLQAE